MKADYAARSGRSGWRRMTFVDDNAAHGDSRKTLASFELHKVPMQSSPVSCDLVVVVVFVWLWCCYPTTTMVR